MNTGITAEAAEKYQNPSIEALTDAQKAYAEAMAEQAKRDKELQARYHFRQLIASRKVMTGRKAGRKRRLYVK